MGDVMRAMDVLNVTPRPSGNSTLPHGARSGDIIRFGNGCSAYIIDLYDNSWVTFEWEWPRAPKVSNG
jgi:hypothetical protein